MATAGFSVITSIWHDPGSGRDLKLRDVYGVSACLYAMSWTDLSPRLAVNAIHGNAPSGNTLSLTQGSEINLGFAQIFVTGFFNSSVTYTCLSPRVGLALHPLTLYPCPSSSLSA